MSDKKVSDGELVRAAHGAGAAIQRVDTPYCTAVAVQVARDLKALTVASQDEAKLMGKAFYYQWEVNDKRSPTGKRLVSGVSIDGAMALLRNWGNATCIPELISAEYESFLFRASFVDFERGVTFARLYRKHRSDPPGTYDEDRWHDMEFADGQSRAMRNAISAGMPSWLVARCMQAAGAKGDWSSTEEASDDDRARARSRAGAERGARAGGGAPTPAPSTPSASASQASAARTEASPASAVAVEGFAKKLRGCWSVAELQTVGVEIRDAKAAGRINDAESAALKEIYRAVADGISDAQANEPENDAVEDPS